MEGNSQKVNHLPVFKGEKYGLRKQKMLACLEVMNMILLDIVENGISFLLDGKGNTFLVLFLSPNKTHSCTIKVFTNSYRDIVLKIFRNLETNVLGSSS